MSELYLVWKWCAFVAERFRQSPYCNDVVDSNPDWRNTKTVITPNRLPPHALLLIITKRFIIGIGMALSTIFVAIKPISTLHVVPLVDKRQAFFSCPLISSSKRGQNPINWVISQPTKKGYVHIKSHLQSLPRSLRRDTFGFGCALTGHAISS